MSDFSSSDEECSDVELEELKKKFNNACDFVQKHHTSIDQNNLVELYGFFKQATCGSCDITKPGMFNFQAKAKWEAWNKMGTMSKEEAMEKYITKLEESSESYRQNSNISQDTNSKSQWVCHSLPTAPNEEINIENKTVFDFVKEKNLEKFKSLINTENVNKLDELGIGIIHWAADRNSIDILEYILKNCSADINLRDTEQQTALHYASSCGHYQCVEFLLKSGADKDLRDDSDQTCLDVAFDDNIKSILLNFK